MQSLCFSSWICCPRGDRFQLFSLPRDFQLLLLDLLSLLFQHLAQAAAQHQRGQIATMRKSTGLTVALMIFESTGENAFRQR